ncbi:MAG: hypothetical protein C5S41_13190 [Candidatus Methanomarinus sp.]|nr:MAG: hypothetical protein C5S41_13190 [ANME-2 cluster archaeon]KAF5425244.1 hypothetical protein C5S42_11140 [ANME-2 cluster archaeon]
MANKHLFNIIAILIFSAIFFIPSFARLALQYLWFDSVGYADVFLVKYKAGIILFLVFTILFALIMLLIYRSGKRNILKSGGMVISFWKSSYFAANQEDFIDVKPEQDVKTAIKAATFPVYIFILLFSVLQGLSISGSWLTILMYLNSMPFGTTDPIFNNDIAFYVYSLPFFKVIISYISSLLFFGILLLAGLYATFNWKMLKHPPFDLRCLLAGFLAFFAARIYLGKYNILYSETGVVYGAGYVDVTISQYIPVIISIVLLLSAIGILIAGRWDTLSVGKILSGMVALIILIWIVSGFATVLIQELKVTPNELKLEKSYITNNINMTNTAYDLSDVIIRQYPVTYNLTTDILNDPSITNARLWDHRPLNTIYQQKQAIRTYYGFNDVDVDRYNIDGAKTQVWLSAREIYYDQLQAGTWQNEHIFYTHGIGIVMSPVTNIVEQGLPEMYIENIPPISTTSSLTISQPRIYYGEKTDTYIFTGTGNDEFDYPSGDTNVVTTYTGTGGINMGFFNRIIATIALGDLKIFTSSDIDENSKLHINRNVVERTELITPYLLQDSDAYIVLSDSGDLYWVLNAFVSSNRYPYSEPVQTDNTRLNYIRDSAKAVVNAYNGTITYYVVEEDPILMSYSKIFPDVFKPYDQMPDELKQHLRYSPDLFLIQSSIYNSYHMKTPEVFYNLEDQWQMSKEKYGDSLIQMEPYNVLLELNGSTEFIMMLPFNPKNKDNMISWMAVGQDHPYYGEKILYKFSKDKLIYGPAQIEALIDQDEDISKDLTLWSQGGSNVIRGNLLVIPIRNSILYIEPLYISAETSSSIPELKKVLVVYNNKVVMEDSLEEAIRRLVDENISTIPTVPAVTDGDNQTMDDLLIRAIDHYNDAKDYLEMGDLENYGREMKIVDDLIDQLEQIIGANIEENVN